MQDRVRGFNRIDPFENDLIASCGFNQQERVRIFDSLRHKLQHNQSNFNIPVTNLTGRSLSYMVAELTYVQQEKVRLRNHVAHNPRSSYRIAANLALHKLWNGYTIDAERVVDPYYLTVQLGQDSCVLIHNYDGGNADYPNQYQPGNCRLRKQAPRSHVITYRNTIDLSTYNSEYYTLMRAVEISRRKIVDEHRIGPLRNDKFFDLPIATGILIATKLINDGYMNVNDFWTNAGDYHVFSGERIDRAQKFDQLAALYRQSYDLPNNFQSLVDQAEFHAPNIFGFRRVRHQYQNLDDYAEAFVALNLN